MTVASGNDSMGPSHKEVGTKKPRCALLKAFRKLNKQKKCFTDRTLLSIQFGLKYIVHRVTDLEKIPNLQG